MSVGYAMIFASECLPLFTKRNVLFKTTNYRSDCIIDYQFNRTRIGLLSRQGRKNKLTYNFELDQIER